MARKASPGTAKTVPARRLIDAALAGQTGVFNNSLPVVAPIAPNTAEALDKLLRGARAALYRQPLVAPCSTPMPF